MGRATALPLPNTSGIIIQDAKSHVGVSLTFIGEGGHTDSVTGMHLLPFS
jgi:hypothetical protein